MKINNLLQAWGKNYPWCDKSNFNCRSAQEIQTTLHFIERNQLNLALITYKCSKLCLINFCLTLKVVLWKKIEKILTLMTFGKVEIWIKSCIKSSTPELLFTTNIQIKLKIKFQIYLTNVGIGQGSGEEEYYRSIFWDTREVNFKFDFELNLYFWGNKSSVCW